MNINQGSFRRVSRIAALALMLAGCATAPAPNAAAGDMLAVPGGRIYYETAGRGDAIVLIHGGFGDSRMWNEQFAALAKDFQVIRYDHRGFGKSPAPAAAYSASADIIRLLDHLKIARAHVIGNSVGGSVALDFARKHPDRTRKVVVVASGANGYPYSDEDAESVRAVFRVAAQLGVDTAAQMWLRHPMIGVSSKHPANGPLVRQMVLDNRGIFTMQHWPEDPDSRETYGKLSEIKAPVLFVVGALDTPISQRVSDSTAARMAGAEIFRMPNADHLPQLVDAAAFNRRGLEFLRR